MAGEFIKISPSEIEAESFRIISEILDEMKIDIPKENESVVKRVIHTTADFSFAETMEFSDNAVEIARKLIVGGATIVTDTNMTLAGINKKRLEKYGVRVKCFMSDEDVAKEAKERNKIMQIALEPTDLYSIEENDDRYVRIAEYMNGLGVKFLVRFACEMNDVTNRWYTQDYEMYKQKFRFVSDIFHHYAPSAAMVWSPNFYPENNIENYYPGDRYVDYVGISSYKHHQPETDPLGQNVDRSRWSAQLDTIYRLYGYKKPIIVSESGASYINHNSGVDITDFAVSQIVDFYTYLPIKYPNLAAAFVFDADSANFKFNMSNNSRYLDGYRKGIQNEAYISSVGDDNRDQYYEIGKNVCVEARTVEVSSYVKTMLNDISYVVYRINGTDVATTYGIPYSTQIDLTPYKGSRADIQALAFDSSGKMVANKAYSVIVQ